MPTKVLCDEKGLIVSHGGARAETSSTDNIMLPSARTDNNDTTRGNASETGDYDNIAPSPKRLQRSTYSAPYTIQEAILEDRAKRKRPRSEITATRPCNSKDKTTTSGSTSNSSTPDRTTHASRIDTMGIILSVSFHAFDKLVTFIVTDSSLSSATVATQSPGKKPHSLKQPCVKVVLRGNDVLSHVIEGKIRQGDVVRFNGVMLQKDYGYSFRDCNNVATIQETILAPFYSSSLFHSPGITGSTACTGSSNTTEAFTLACNISTDFDYEAKSYHMTKSASGQDGSFNVAITPASNNTTALTTSGPALIHTEKCGHTRLHSSQVPQHHKDTASIPNATKQAQRMILGEFHSWSWKDGPECLRAGVSYFKLGSLPFSFGAPSCITSSHSAAYGNNDGGQLEQRFRIVDMDRVPPDMSTPTNLIRDLLMWYCSTCLREQKPVLALTVRDPERMTT